MKILYLHFWEASKKKTYSTKTIWLPIMWNSLYSSHSNHYFRLLRSKILSKFHININETIKTLSFFSWHIFSWFQLLKVTIWANLSTPYFCSLNSILFFVSQDLHFTRFRSNYDFEKRVVVCPTRNIWDWISNFKGKYWVLHTQSQIYCLQRYFDNLKFATV